MKRAIRFKDNPDAASRVLQHLYHVVQDGETLIFSEFDEAAFRVAVALEGLGRIDYRYVSDNPIPPAPTGIALRAFGRPRISLDLTLEVPENHYHALSLNVLPGSSLMPSDGYSEFPLVIDFPFSHLIRILRRTMYYESAEQKQAFTDITTNLESACIQIHNHAYSHRESACVGNLTLSGSNQSQSILLNLFGVSFNINHPILE